MEAKVASQEHSTTSGISIITVVVERVGLNGLPMAPRVWTLIASADGWDKLVHPDGRIEDAPSGDWFDSVTDAELEAVMTAIAETY